MQASGGGESGGSHAAGTYRSLRSNRPSHALGDINVTPLVDVVLVLLLVFMVTAPMMSRGIDVTLPVANPPQANDEGQRLIVSVNAREQIFINEKAINAVLLEERLRDMMEGRANKVVYLYADESLRYGRVIAVVDKLKKAGVEQIGFAYQLPQEKAQR